MLLESVLKLVQQDLLVSGVALESLTQKKPESVSVT